MLKHSFIKIITPKYKLILFLSIYQLFQVSFINAQINRDSLFAILKNTESPDTVKLRTLGEIVGKIYIHSNPDSALYFARMQYDFARKTNSLLFQSYALNWMGVCMYLKGDYTKAIEYYERCLSFEESFNTVNVLNNIGLIYINQNEYEKAKKYYLKSLALYNKNYQGQGNILGTIYGNLGIIYSETGNFEKAFKYFDLAQKSNEENNNLYGVTDALNYKGVLFLRTKEYKKAEECFKLCISMAKKTNNLRMEGYSTSNLGEIYLLQNRRKEAKSNLLKGLKIAQNLDNYDMINGSAALLVKLYREEAKFREALDMYEIYLASRDSLQKLENTKAILELDFKVKTVADSIKNAEIQKVSIAKLDAEKARNEILSIETKQKKQQSYFLYGGLVISLLFGGVIFNRFRLTNNQKVIIESQKSEVDKAYIELADKNKSITDSINYAKRIQAAILPSEKAIQNYLPESFILYKPKDIVAGDFYWIDKKNNKIFFAVADCTGHGVPGAMVSVICNNALNKAFRENEIDDTGKILDKINEIVIEQFSRNDKEVSDGMDISLCALDLNNLSLTFSGANNDLYLIRGKELLEFKADRQPIGKYPERKLFSTQTIDILANDIIYLFSDGFADQFGGPYGKKFKYKAFKELLISNCHKSLGEQNQELSKAFVNWKKNLEQVDDVCVMGVKVVI